MRGMHIQSANTYTSLVGALRAHSAKPPTNKTDNSQSSLPEAKPSPPAPVTGGISGLLSGTSAGQLIQQSQSTEATSDVDTSLPIGERHWMEDIANNPAYAAQKAEQAANSVVLVPFSMGPQPGQPFPILTPDRTDAQPHPPKMKP
jgi:hypothetical protein